MGASGHRGIFIVRGMLERMKSEIFDKYIYGYPEQIIPIDEGLVCGTSDYIGQVNRSTVDIWDWKTNLTGIKYYSERNKYFKKPVAHLSDCTFNEYALKTSCYGYMLK
jgi:hypothetical protein